MFNRMTILILALAATVAAQNSRIITTFVGGGTANPPADSLALNLQQTRGIAVDAAGNLYILRLNDVLRVTRDGLVTRFAGGGTLSSANVPAAGVAATAIGFTELAAIAVDPAGIVYVADNFPATGVSGDTRVFEIAGGTVRRIAGGGPDVSNGSANTARISQVRGLAAQSGSVVYLTSGDGRVRRISGGRIDTVAGILQANGDGPDGQPGAQTALSGPKALAIDGNFLLIGGTTCGIRRLNLTTQLVDTLPGTAVSQCDRLHSLAVRSGVVFIGSDFALNQVSGGVVSRVAGVSTGTLTDGIAPEIARLPSVTLVATDPGSDRLYVALDNRFITALENIRAITTERVQLGASSNVANGGFVPLIDNVAVPGLGATVAVIPGTVHSVEAPGLIVANPDLRFRFANFIGVSSTAAPGGATVPRVTRAIGWAPVTRFGTTYVVQNRLTVSVANPEGGRVSLRVVNSNSPAALVQTELSAFFDNTVTVALTALPNEGFTVQNFAEGGTSVSSASPFNVNMVSPRNVSAIFRTPLNTFKPLRLNSGGASFVDSLGQSWGADEVAVISTNEQIAGTADQGLYRNARQSARAALGTGGAIVIPIAYEFAVPEGTYNLRLKFADFLSTAAGQRKFNVLVNGAPVLTEFDIFAEAGGRSRALDKLFSVPSQNGKITLTLAAGSAGQAMLNAVQLIANAVGVTVSPAHSTLHTGQSLALVPTVAGAPDESVTWKLEPEVGSISAEGVYSAPAAIEKRQAVTITATSRADASKSAQAFVTLTPRWSVATSDGFTFAHQPLEGDGSVIAHVNLDGAGAALQAGVMIRASADGPFVFAGLGPGLTAISRSGSAKSEAGSGLRWVKMTREGDRFTPYHSLDGVTWQAGAPFEVAMPATALAGLAIFAGEAGDQAADPAQSPLFDSAAITGAAAIELSHVAGSVAAGEALQLDAKVTGIGDRRVVWSLQPPVGTITASGLYQAPPESAAAPGPVTITATSVGDPRVQASAELQVGSFRRILVNAGGAAEGAFSGDIAFTGGQAVQVEGEELAGVDRTVRRSSSEPFDYRFAVPAGEYTVRLHFIETDPAQALRRRFDVRLNGQTVLERFDIIEAAGGFRQPVAKQFRVRVENGELRLSFIPGGGEATVSAIEVLE